jgi:hypothetical protein
MSDKSTDKTVGGGTSSISAHVKIGTEWTQSSRGEQESNKRLLEITQSLLPSYGNNWNAHSVLTLRRQSISRILYYDYLYKKILDVPGVICEFGVQWGTTLAQLMAFRGIYEPYNHSRKIYGFDTFEGFPVIDEKDHGFSQLGDYSVNSGHIELLEEILTIHESYSPLSHIKKFDLVKGDASLTVGPWLAANPHAIISMAIFDMDVYKPTRDVLELILPRLTKGSLLVFDELNAETFPGETRAVDEVLGLNNIRLRHNSNQPLCAWAVFGE